FAGRGGCPPLLGEWRPSKAGVNAFDQGCPKFNEAVQAFIRDRDVASIVLAARWSLYATQTRGGATDVSGYASRGSSRDVFQSAIEHTLDELRGRTVVIVEQVPEQKAQLPTAYIILNRLGRPTDGLAIDQRTHEAQQRLVLEALDRIARDNMF